MSLKTIIEETLCVLKNGEYKILSQKLRVINDSLNNDIVETTHFLNEHSPKLVDRIRYILKEKNSVNTCLFCSSPIINLDRMFCSAKCNNNSEQTKDKFREKYNILSDDDKMIRNKKRGSTFHTKYGGYTLQSNELKNKVRSTMVEKYGVEHPFHNDVSKQKALNTWILKYGVDNPFKSIQIKEKIKLVLKYKYGVDNACNIDSLSRISKIQQTKIDRGWIIPDEFLSDYKIYRKKIRRLTELTYKTNKHIINPDNFERVTNGKVGFQLDHRYSIVEGFLNDVEPEIISHCCNLQMLEWNLNREKSKSCDIDLEKLINEINNYEKR